MPRIYIALSIERRIREDAQNRCGYCLAPQQLVMAQLEIEHIIPQSAFAADDPEANAENNLWLACPICNGHKSDKTTFVDPTTGESVPLFNPRRQSWFEHFQWSEDGLHIIGLTATGRATVDLLHLDNDPLALVVRANWVAAGWHPPKQ
jgi:hypothetical protein